MWRLVPWTRLMPLRMKSLFPWLWGSAEAPGEEGDGWGAPIVMLGEVGMTWFVPS